jgi:hypothetical protein
MAAVSTDAAVTEIVDAILIDSKSARLGLCPVSL